MVFSVLVWCLMVLIDFFGFFSVVFSVLVVFWWCLMVLIINMIFVFLSVFF